MTRQDVPQLFDRLTELYRNISTASDWHALRAAEDLDQINVIIDKREVMLREIREIDEVLRSSGAAEEPQFQAKYTEVNNIIREILDSDQNVMKRITDRMNVIREELKNRALFRTRALPGYIKQKYAFSK